MVPPTFQSRLFSHRFDAATHVRKVLITSPFIMFYMTFTLEQAFEMLARHGVELEVRRPCKGSDLDAM